MVFPFFVPIRLEDCPVCEVCGKGICILLIINVPQKESPQASRFSTGAAGMHRRIQLTINRLQNTTPQTSVNLFQDEAFSAIFACTGPNDGPVRTLRIMEILNLLSFIRMTPFTSRPKNQYLLLELRYLSYLCNGRW